MKKVLFLITLMFIGLLGACSDDDKDSGGNPIDPNDKESFIIEQKGEDLMPLKVGNLWEYVSYEFDLESPRDTVTKTGRYAYSIKFPELNTIKWTDLQSTYGYLDSVLTYKFWEKVDNLNLNQECQGGGVIIGFGIKGNQLLIPKTPRFNDTLFMFETLKNIDLNIQNNCREKINGVEYDAYKVSLSEGYNSYDKIWFVRGIGVVRREMTTVDGHILGFRLVNNKIK